MYKFQDLTPIAGHFRTNFKISGISGQCPGLLEAVELPHLVLFKKTTHVQRKGETKSALLSSHFQVFSLQSYAQC